MQSRKCQGRRAAACPGCAHHWQGAAPAGPASDPGCASTTQQQGAPLAWARCHRRRRPAWPRRPPPPALGPRAPPPLPAGTAPGQLPALQIVRWTCAAQDKGGRRQLQGRGREGGGHWSRVCHRQQASLWRSMHKDEMLGAYQPGSSGRRRCVQSQVTPTNLADGCRVSPEEMQLQVASGRGGEERNL